MEKRIIHIGADPFPPYQYIDEHGQVRGLDYEAVKNMFRDAGYEISVQIDAWNVVEEKFKKGKLDALFQVQKSPERKAQYCFSPLLRNAVTEVITSNKELDIKEYCEISQKKLKLGVLKGYSYGIEIDSMPMMCKIYYESSKDLLQAVAQREVELGVFDKGVKEYLVSQLNLTGIYGLKELEFLRPLYVMYHRANGL